MNRREFIMLVVGSTFANWQDAQAQQPNKPIVGFLSGAARREYEPYVAAFRDGLQNAGFDEGRNLAIEYRFADGAYDHLSALAAELIQDGVSVIAADPRGVYAAQAVTKTIPIVFVSGADPVRNKLVASLNRPGGNLTGVTVLASDLNAKRLGLFHDLVPQAAVIGVLSDSTNPRGKFAEREVLTAAGNIKVPVRLIRAGTEKEVDAAFASFAREGVRAALVINGFFLFSHSDQVNELARRYRIALSGEERKFSAGGALMSYGPSLAKAFYEIGVYTGRVLKGERPGDLPVVQPTKFELVINLKAAKALGITIPQTLLAAADEVIE